MSAERSRLRPGWGYGAVSIVLAASTAAVIAVSAWEFAETGARLAIGSVLLFVIALLLGSRGMVGATGVMLLGSAVISSIGLDDPAWVRSAVVGVFWYLTVELAWASIDRRDGVRRTSGFANRQADEATNVILMSLAVSGGVYLLSGYAPLRNVYVVGISAIVLAVAYGAISRQLTARR